MSLGYELSDADREKDATAMKTTGRKKKPEIPMFDDKGYQAKLTHLNGTPLPNLVRVKVAPLKSRLPNRQMKADAAASKFATLREDAVNAWLREATGAIKPSTQSLMDLTRGD